MNPLRILAFDPGFERLGVAVVEKKSGRDILLYSHCFRTSSKLPFPERLRLLGEEATRVLKEFSPQVVALEDVYFEKNAKTAMQVAQVRGVLCYIASSHGIEVTQHSPLAVKLAVTGYGGSDKTAVAMMVPRLLQLPPRKRLDDEIDAIAVALTCLATRPPLIHKNTGM